MKAKKIQLIIFAAAAIIVLLGLAVYSQRASLKANNVSLGMPTYKLRLSFKTFAYNEAGHFGNKTQFEGRQPDSFGGSYYLHCRDGKVYAVEVLYPAGLEKNKSDQVLERILKTGLSKSQEHDISELSMKDCPKPSEYYYFDQGKVGAQLEHDQKEQDKIVRIYCWLS